MKIILLVVSLIASVVASAQNGYTKFYGGYLWNDRGAFLGSFHTPAGTTPALPVGAWVRSGALYYDSTGGNKGYHHWNGSTWVRLIDTTMGYAKLTDIPAAADVSTSSSFTPNLLDTMETKEIVLGEVNLRDNAFPNALMTPAGTVLVGWAKPRAHSFAGITDYIRSSTQGLTYSAPVVMESDTNWNYRNLIFSNGRNDTTFAHYWSGLTNRIYFRHSVDDGITWSTKDSLPGSLAMATENEIRLFGDYYVMPVYSFAPSANQTGIAYTTDLSGGTWTFSMLPAGWDAYEFNESDLVIEGDTLFLFARSEVEPDSLYRFYTLDKTTWSTVPVVSRPPEWEPGKPDILRMPDGRYLMNYRTEDGSPPNEGAIAISNDQGRTWTKVYDQTQATFTYGSTISLGGDRYLNVHSCTNDPVPYGTVYQHVYVIPRKDLLNSNKIAFDNFGANWNWTKHIIDQSDSVLRGAYYGTGYLNVRQIANTVGSAINIYHNSTNNNTSLSHVSNIFSIGLATNAAPTVRELRARFYEPTVTGTDRIFDIGDDHLVGLQDGTLSSQKPFLRSGAGYERDQNTFGTRPTGSSGYGLERGLVGSRYYFVNQNLPSGNGSFNFNATDATFDAILKVNTSSFFGGTSTPSALVHIAAGTTVAGTAPIKINEGAKLTAAEDGAIEKDDAFYFTKTNAVRYGGGGALKTVFADVGNVGAGEDDLQTFSIPAGTLSQDGDYIEFTATFTVAVDATLKMFYGATQLFSVAATSGNGNYNVVGRIIRTGAATQKATGEIMAGLGGIGAFRAAPTETLSGAIIIKGTGEGVSNNDIVQTAMVIKYFPAN